MLYPLSYGGGRLASLPPDPRPLVRGQFRRGSAGDVVHAEQCDQVVVATIRGVLRVVLADPGRHPAWIGCGCRDSSVHGVTAFRTT